MSREQGIVCFVSMNTGGPILFRGSYADCQNFIASRGLQGQATIR